MRLTGAPLQCQMSRGAHYFCPSTNQALSKYAKANHPLKMNCTDTHKLHAVQCTVYFYCKDLVKIWAHEPKINHALTNFDNIRRWKTEDTEGLLRFVVIEQSHLLKTQKLCNAANEKILLWCILFVSLRSCLTSWLSIANFANKFSAIMNNWYPHFLIAMFSNKENAIPNPKAVTFKMPQFTVTIPRASG